MSKRRRAREMAVQMLYQHDLGGASTEQIFLAFDPVRRPDDDEAGGAERAGAERRPSRSERPPASLEAFAYARTLVEGTLEHLDEIDALIRQQADHWRLERMPAVDRNILRLAVFEFLYETDVPKLVVIDEAIELAKRFGTDQSGRFVNGLLDGLLKAHRFPGSLT